MQVILKADVKHLGTKGQVVKVKDGYYRNYLLPQGFAEFANQARLKQAEKRASERMKQGEEIKQKASEIKATLDGQTITIKAKTTGKNTLYAAVKSSEIIKSIAENFKIKLVTENIHTLDHLKTTGKHEVEIKLSEETSALITVNIEAAE